MPEASGFLDQSDFLRGVLDALPVPLFVTDDDVTILALNPAAAAMAKPGAAKLHLRGGELLGCVHASETPGGCGRSPACDRCVVRSSVRSAFGGAPVRRERADLELHGDGEVRTAHVLVTASPLEHAGRRMVLLALEDVGEIVALRGLIPICAWCKKVRNDANYWESVERYLASRSDVRFTHCICEDCASEVRRQRLKTP